MKHVIITNVPQGANPSLTSVNASRLSDSGEPASCAKQNCEPTSTSISNLNHRHKIRPKQTFKMGTINIQTMMKVGKLKQVLDSMRELGIGLLALQETRFRDESTMESEGYVILKGKPGVGRSNQPFMFGTAFVVDRRYLDSITEWKGVNERLSYLTMKIGNKTYTIVNAHAPTNDKNKKDKAGTEHFWSTLDKVMTDVDKRGVTILLGDFNAQIGMERKFRGPVGDYPAHKRTNKNGERLVDLCRRHKMRIMTTHYKAKASKKMTWVSPGNRIGEKQLDHVAIRDKNHKEIMNTKVRKNTRMESDHYLVEIKCRWIPNRARKCRTINTHRIDLDLLKKHRAEYAKRMVFQSDWESVRDMMEEEAVRLATNNKKRKHEWWTDECENAVETRRKAWMKWHSCKKQADWLNFQDARKIASKTIRKAKRSRWNEKLEEANTAFKKHKSRVFFREMKNRIKGFEAREPFVIGQDGAIKIGEKEVCEEMARYFRDLLNAEAPTVKWTHLRSRDESQDSLDNPPTRAEVREAIKNLKSSKASGNDGICAEEIKWGGPEIERSMYNVIMDIWKNKKIPVDWREAIIIPLHKKGDKKVLDNYRGISLLNIGYKILSRILLTRVEEQLGPTIGEYQCGFRKGRNCAEQIFAIKRIIEHRHRKGKKTIVTFVDFKKAYDSIDRSTLLDVLEDRGLDATTHAIIKETLSNTTARIRHRSTLSDSFEIKTGVRQGDGLSPILFNLVLDEVVRQWRQLNSNMKIKGVQIGYKVKHNAIVDCLAFADDMALLNETEEEAKTALKNLAEVAEKVGLKIAYSKTKTLNTESDWKIDGQVVAKVNSFRYLGEKITGGIQSNSSAVDRAQLLQKLRHAVKTTYGKKNLSRNAKLRHYTATVRNAALYASETITLGKRACIQLEKEERKILRDIWGTKKHGDIWIHRTRQELYENTEPISSEIRKRRLRFVGHIMRMDDERLTKKIWNATCHTGNNWMKEVRDDWKAVGIKERNLQAVVQDREKYKGLVDGHRWPDTKIKVVLTDEERKRRSERMKRYWEERRRAKQATRDPEGS